MNTEYITLIAQNHLFRGIDFAGIEYMLTRCTIRELQCDEVLLHPDEPNQHLHLILKGELSVELVGQKMLKHTSVTIGDCVGEISLVDGKLPSALVVALGTSRVLSIPHETVWSLVDHSHAVARNLLTIIAGRMRNDNHALIASQNDKAQIEYMASVDALTGIHNRRWMEEVFPRALQRNRFNRQPITLMVLDIDHFKKVNDQHGHLTGDRALKHVAHCLSTHQRPNDLLVRYGGEEFAALLPNTSLADAQSLGTRLCGVIASNEVQHNEIRINLTVSIGIAQATMAQSLEEVFDAADSALYRAKRQGRNRVEVYAP